MKIATIIENSVNQVDMKAEHGLAIYIESKHTKILFDTGQSGAFIHNAKIMEIPLEDLDYLVLSHGHYDHTGGLKYLLELNPKLCIICKKSLFLPKYSKNNRFVGTSLKLEDIKNPIRFIDDDFQIDEEIHVISNIPIINEQDTHFTSFTYLKDGKLEPDTFEDELFLVLKNNNQISIISSCSHRGISNIVKAAINKFNLPVHLILGGFHIDKADDIAATSLFPFFKEVNPNYIGVCHCTGIEKYALFKAEFGEKTFYNQTGKKLFI